MSRVQGPRSKVQSPRSRILVSLTAVCAVAFALNGSAQAPDDPIRWALALPSPTASVSPGGIITLSLTATVDDGWHLYATTLGPGGPIPTAINVPTGQVFTLSGDIAEPTPSSAFDTNFSKVLEFHEGTVKFGIPLKAATSASLGQQPARVAISFQTCNDRMCLPPKQIVTTVQVPVMPGTAQRAPVPPDRDAFNKALSVKDLGEQIIAIERYAADFPDSDTVYFATARGMRNIGDTDGANTARLADFVHHIEQTMDDAGAKGTARKYQRADVYYNMANRLLQRRVLIHDAARLAAKSVPLLSEDDFMAKELATHNERQANAATRTPGRQPDPFPREESEERWRGVRANHLSALGRALLELGHLPEAESTLKQSFDFAPVMETAIALATIAEKAGRLDDALTMAVAAELTGKMTAERAYLETLYRKTHQDSLEGLDALLDRTYRAAHKNPIVAPAYTPTPGRTSRTVLAELFTGAACVPCVSVDLSFERELERYTLTELALLVYHIHAPTSDPYSNFAVEARSQYYGVHGAPTVFLDGVVAPIGEGGGAMAVPMFAKLDAAIGTRLETAPAGQIAASATRTGQRIDVTMRVSGGPESSQTVRLHAALVETEASYSGENGLRIQPMIVRDMLGRDNDRGADISKNAGQAVTWQIDLATLTASNLAYYDWYIADLKKRANIDATFREKKPAMNPAHLSIVVFLQDDVTHQVLQTAFVTVANSGR